MKSTIAITVDPDVLAKAKRMNINLSGLLNEYLTYYVQRHEGNFSENKTDQADPVIDKRVQLLKIALEEDRFQIPEYWNENEKRRELFLWEKGSEYAKKFDLKPEKSIEIIENYLRSQKEKLEKERIERQNNVQKEALLKRIFNRND
ncbi:MAG: type II toxin-antitoxin system CcdA family antitoxin [Nitrososphaeria archaeon]